MTVAPAPETRFLTLDDFYAIGSEVLRVDRGTIEKVTDEGLADSALHSPAAGFGDYEAYPEFDQKKQQCCCGMSRRTTPCPMETSVLR